MIPQTVLEHRCEEKKWQFLISVGNVFFKEENYYFQYESNNIGIWSEKLYDSIVI